jgi:hypothetical protein
MRRTCKPSASDGVMTLDVTVYHILGLNFGAISGHWVAMRDWLNNGGTMIFQIG